MTALEYGDWIIYSRLGEPTPCKRDIFAERFEPYRKPWGSRIHDVMRRLGLIGPSEHEAQAARKAAEDEEECREALRRGEYFSDEGMHRPKAS